MHHLDWLDFADLPQSENGFSTLYRDYVDSFPSVKRFYAQDFRSSQSYPKHAESIRKDDSVRSIVADVLSEQNRALGTGELTHQNIAKLSGHNTYAIVTGQQVGLLGGPLYTLYKTITAIKLAKRLQEQYPDLNFVPVFWLEVEDHDFDEVNKVGVLNAEGLPAKIEFQLRGKPSSKNVGAVGEIVLDDSIPQFFEDLTKTLQNSEFKAPLIEQLRSIYSPKANFGSSFARWLMKLLPDEGLVFISSNDKRLKSILSPIFQKEITEYPRVSQLIIQQSAELEECYHAQIKTRAMNIFLYHKGGRYLIEPREHDFSLRGTRHFISKEEMMRIAVEQPELISPNVALRPICQDMLLPTLAYVAGPSEVAYFAQLRTVYDYFGLTMPIIYPRASATIVEDRVERVMDKFQLPLTDFFANGNLVDKKVIEMTSEVKVEEMFANVTKRMDDHLKELHFGLNYLDPTLLGTLEHTRSKIESQMKALMEKADAAQKRKHETALRQIERASGSIFPNGNYQERELSAVYFMNKYGPDFPRQIYDLLEIDQFKHQLLHA